MWDFVRDGEGEGADLGWRQGGARARTPQGWFSKVKNQRPWPVPSGAARTLTSHKPTCKAPGSEIFGNILQKQVKTNPETGVREGAEAAAKVMIDEKTLNYFIHDGQFSFVSLRSNFEVAVISGHREGCHMFLAGR